MLRMFESRLRTGYILLIFTSGLILLLLPRTKLLKLNSELNVLIKSMSNNSNGCQIPMLDPWDKSIMQYYQKVYPLQCKSLQPQLIVIRNQTLFWDQLAIKEHNLDMGSLSCESRCVHKTRDDIEAKFDAFKESPNGTVLTCDIVNVKCTHGTFRLNVYDKYLSHVVPDIQKIRTAPRGKPNIILLIIDAQSRSNFIRQLPNTYKHLMDELGAIEFTGLNKAAVNSYPNGMALFADEKVDPLTPAEKRGPFDDYPLIFQNFSRIGYITQWVADWPKYDMWNYDWKGNGLLGDKPFDHYQRPLWLALWHSMLHLRSTNLCYDNTPKHKILLDYINSMFDSYPIDVPKFSMAWVIEVGHQFVNNIGKMDSDLLNSIKSLQKHLDNSYLIVMGDHGHRVDKIRESLVGRYEDRLPFFSVSLPKWLGAKYPERKVTFENNAKQRRLITFYDVFAMMAEILHETLGNDTPHPVDKGISLFRPIPENRSCSDIYIDTSDCSCSSNYPINYDHKYATAAATAILDYVNNLIATKHIYNSNAANCINYDQVIVKHAVLQLPQSEQLGDILEFVDLIVNINLFPGNVLIESRTSLGMYSDKINVLSIDRINRYGNQSHCTEEAALKPFCFCDDVILSKVS